MGEQDALGPTGQPRDPNPRLASHPNVVMTPHISGNSDVRARQPFAFDLFVDNLRLFLNGDALINLVDWERAY
jgi:phosphoglycerate dehydrogenase-like enzyme